jgi:hypothetical protein
MAMGAAATFTVTKSADAGSGTLRDALAMATNGDTIDFSLPAQATITLTSGQLMVSNSVFISGPGPNNLTVDGNQSNRVFYIAPSSTVLISGLTISNGLVTGSYPAGGGGGIRNDHATLTLSNCVVSGNTAAAGGGILNDGLSGAAVLQILSSTISNNSGSNAGGIYNNGESSGAATLTITACTLSGNRATSGGTGGGIYNDGSHSGSAGLQVITSTLSSNAANAYGGGIYNDASLGRATLAVNASTLSGNSAGQFGGSIMNIGNVTGAKLDIGDTILQAGGSGQNFYNLGGTVTSHGYNLSSDNGGGFLLAAGDQILADPKLGPLQDNGGPTFTHALLTGSPAIDKGKRDAVSALALNADQRGLARPVDLPTIANASGGDGSDIGAFEFQSATGPTAPLLTGASILPDGSFQFNFTNAAGATFTVFSTTNIASPASSWSALGAPTEISPGQYHFTDPQATNRPLGFYRVRSP